MAWLGSEHHKEVFCREFLYTHQPYQVASLRWPALDPASRERLRSLPFWDEAVATERLTAAKVQAQTALETDPLIRRAVALQGAEEKRHSQLLDSLLRAYDIQPAGTGALVRPVAVGADIEWAFMRAGYGECFDSFFAFGLFAVAKDSGFFPAALIERFEPVIQEEARHILFFVNWLAYRRIQLGWWQQPVHLGRRLTALTVQAWRRLRTARGMDDEHFTIRGHEAIDLDISPRGFLGLCLRENERRLGVYDRRLLRPRLVPTLARAVCRFLR